MHLRNGLHGRSNKRRVPCLRHRGRFGRKLRKICRRRKRTGRYVQRRVGCCFHVTGFGFAFPLHLRRQRHNGRPYQPFRRDLSAVERHEQYHIYQQYRLRLPDGERHPQRPSDGGWQNTISVPERQDPCQQRHSQDSGQKRRSTCSLRLSGWRHL